MLQDHSNIHLATCPLLKRMKSRPLIQLNPFFNWIKLTDTTHTNCSVFINTTQYFENLCPGESSTIAQTLFHTTNTQRCVRQKPSPSYLYYPTADRPFTYVIDHHAQWLYILQEYSALLLTTQHCNETYLILGSTQALSCLLQFIPKSNIQFS